jgi:hypothetical protein
LSAFVDVDVFDRDLLLPLAPVPIERLGDHAELHNEVARKVLGLRLASLLAPEAN